MMARDVEWFIFACPFLMTLHAVPVER